MRTATVSIAIAFACILGPCRLQAQLTTSNLPILLIDTEGGQPIVDEPKVPARLRIAWDSTGGYNSIEGPFNHFDGLIGIEIRGSSSAGFDKKSYAFETRNPDGSNLNVPLLGLPKENDWVLHGPFSDKSLMRNALTYTVAGWIMRYAPRVRYVELFLNGDYQGVYVFTEKIKRDKNRVAIAELNPDENEGDDLTGGYILKFDKTEGAFNDGFASKYPADLDGFGTSWFLYHYPKPDEITPQQKDYIQQYIHHLEDVLHGPDFADPHAGYRSLFDMTSFYHYLFMQELGRNVDAYRLSTYFYKDKDSKDKRLFMGPVWDFNLAFGNADYCDGWKTTGWVWQFNDICPGDFWIVHFWWERLWQDREFRREMGKRWLDLRQDTLSDQRIFHLIDSLQLLLTGPAQRNFQRFPILGHYVWPNAYVGASWDDEVRYLRNWLGARLAWLDAQMTLFAEPDYLDAEAFPPKVWPNPAGDIVHFEYYVRKEARVTIDVFDPTGASMLHHTDDQHLNGVNRFDWQADLPAGLYFYRILFDGEKVAHGKIIRH